LIKREVEILKCSQRPPERLLNGGLKKKETSKGEMEQNKGGRDDEGGGGSFGLFWENQERRHRLSGRDPTSEGCRACQWSKKGHRAQLKYSGLPEVSPETRFYEYSVGLETRAASAGARKGRSRISGSAGNSPAVDKRQQKTW